MADDPTPAPDPTPDDPTPDPEPDDALAGLDDRTRALVERANTEAATRRRELRSEKQKREGVERELAELRAAQESEQERLVREAEQRGFERAVPMLLEAEMAIAAAGRLRDPGDAARLIGEDVRTELLAMTDPTARRERAVQAVEELIEAKPYMAVDANGGSPPATGDLVTQGGRSSQRPGESSSPDAWIRGQHRRG